MSWQDNYDDKSIDVQQDMYGREYKRGSFVAWASHSGNRPKIVDGNVVGFNRSPSFVNTFIITKHNRVVKKNHNQLIVIE